MTEPCRQLPGQFKIWREFNDVRYRVDVPTLDKICVFQSNCLPVIHQRQWNSKQIIVSRKTLSICLNIENVKCQSTCKKKRVFLVQSLLNNCESCKTPKFDLELQGRGQEIDDFAEFYRQPHGHRLHANACKLRLKCIGCAVIAKNSEISTFLL